LNVTDFGGAGAVADLVKSVIGRIWPDPAAQGAAQLELAKLAMSGELARMTNDSGLMLAQIGVNKAEAESEGNFKGGWRPFIGWVCGASLAWNFIARPGVMAVAALSGHPVTLPPVEIEQLLVILGGMLGMSGMRTVEKLQGKQ